MSIIDDYIIAMKTKLPRLFQSMSDPDVLVTEQNLPHVLCECGSTMAFVKEDFIYIPDRGHGKYNKTYRCLRCKEQWRFVEILPFDYFTIPVAVAIEYYFRDLIFWFKRNTVSIVLVAIILWFITLCLILNSK